MPNDQDGGQAKESFWGTAPGLLTAIAGLITALGTILGVLYTNGVLSGPPQTTPTSGSTLRVTRVALDIPDSPAAASPRLRYNGQCPYTVDFVGSIDVVGNGEVLYRFVRESGLSGPEEAGDLRSVAADSSQTVRVYDNWTINYPEGTVGFKETLEVVEPSARRSEPVDFVITCDPLAPPGPNYPPPDVGDPPG